MCGIAGLIVKKPNLRAPEHLRKMTDALRHRGPDGEGQWSNRSNTVHLGHRRLAVLDLSDKAVQPMAFAGRYQVIHNGEIYNHTEIRSFLQNKGYTFATKSDTEVIVAAYDFWKEKCVQQFDGMFSFVIWDEKEEQFFAARDRFGEKPFYYYEDDGHFVFASEMKALWAIGIEKKYRRKMMLNYLTLGLVQNCADKEQTFFEDIFALPPSHYISFKPFQKQLPKTTRYWSINKEIKIEISENDAVEKFNELLLSSVNRRLRSDVPLGTSLSGGIDSSSIVHTINSLRQNSPHTLKTFSAVFPGFENDESANINLFKKISGVNNYQAAPSADDLVSDFEKLCYHQEEPFQSSGIYAQYKIYELAKQNGVTVVLDGQGADEILAGYPKYIHWYLQEVLSRHKLGAAEKEKSAFRKNGQQFRWDFRNMVAAFLPAHAAMQLEKREYQKTISHPGISAGFLDFVKGQEWEGIHKPIVTKLNDILHFNTTVMGLEELLRFADRNSMAHGLEVRLPFLNHELVEFVFSLPSPLKMHLGYTKYLLRRAMDKKLPDEIVWQKNKIGFETPQKSWMQQDPLNDYIQESKRKLVSAGILDKKILNKKIEPMAVHTDKNYDWRYLCAAQII